VEYDSFIGHLVTSQSPVHVPDITALALYREGHPDIVAAVKGGVDAELMGAGCAKVYAEKVCGARSDRPELGKLLRRVEAGDLLIVTRLDRLARSTRDLLNILHMLGESGAKFKSLHDPWADTTTPQGELLVTILAGFATFERHLIKARTDDGRKRAQARGVRFGRPRKLDQHQRHEALQRLASGETLVDVARTYGVDPTTIGRLQSPFPEGAGAA
jgi:DNA invertase Pin-like site-specific DNA recombinase